jgi:hypothetical protein
MGLLNDQKNITMMHLANYGNVSFAINKGKMHLDFRVN